MAGASPVTRTRRMSSSPQPTADVTVPLLRMGFRPFFAGALLVAVLAMLCWALAWRGVIAYTPGAITLWQWHAHEMIYGYALAVVAGFLLTAVRNWTGIATLRGAPLAALAALWLAARVAYLFGPALALPAGVLDVLFGTGLVAAVAAPLVRARQWRQAGILAKLALLVLGNVAFGLGALGVLAQGARWGVYGGLYILVSLVLTIAGRVLPGFIERGVDERVTVSSPRLLSVFTLLLFVAFFVNDLFVAEARVSALLAFALAAVTAVRLWLWRVPGLWRKPLLWGLYLAVGFIAVGFFLLGLAALSQVSALPGIHALAAGGIGLATTAMMTRVTLGHTGRNVLDPPRWCAPALVLVAAAAVSRFAVPWLAPDFYLPGVGAAFVLWLAALLLLGAGLLPLLSAPRADGAEG